MDTFRSAQRLFDLFMLTFGSTLWISSKKNHTTKLEHIEHVRDHLITGGKHEPMFLP